MAEIKKINHVAIVVEDIEQSLDFWKDTLGIQMDHMENVPFQNVKVAFLSVGDSEIELVQPTSEDTGTAKFLKTRGPGMHHICLEVDDIDAMLADLRVKDVKLINETPIELEGRKMAFIHPKSSNGVLIELYQIL